MAYDLQLSHVGKVYDNGTPAVIDFNLDVDKGEFIAFLGPPAAASRRRCA